MKKNPLVMFEFESLDGLKRRQNMGRLNPSGVPREYHLPIAEPLIASDTDRPRRASDYFNVSRRVYKLIGIENVELIVVCFYKEQRR